MRDEYLETPKSEILQAALENAIYGFLGSIIVSSSPKTILALLG